jgi:hypothetical protein
LVFNKLKNINDIINECKLKCKCLNDTKTFHYQTLVFSPGEFYCSYEPICIYQKLVNKVKLCMYYDTIENKIKNYKNENEN